MRNRSALVFGLIALPKLGDSACAEKCLCREDAHCGQASLGHVRFGAFHPIKNSLINLTYLLSHSDRMTESDDLHRYLVSDFL
ncbi:MAG: hypothetical protein HOG15_13315 [Anaerolineae bacterium]|jgi:hypothetical protein|nr:hypothetical protein [Anaerolineae bacterium]